MIVLDPILVALSGRQFLAFTFADDSDHEKRNLFGFVVRLGVAAPRSPISTYQQYPDVL